MSYTISDSYNKSLYQSIGSRNGNYQEKYLQSYSSDGLSYTDDSDDAECIYECHSPLHFKELQKITKDELHAVYYTTF